jgi:hypothetical protein
MRYQDTDPEAERVLIELTRRASPWQRMTQASELTQACRELVMDDLRRRHPQATVAELRVRLAARVLPRDDVMRVYGWDPAEKGY